MKKIIALMILVIYCDFLFGNSFEEMKEIMKAQRLCRGSIFLEN